MTILPPSCRSREPQLLCAVCQAPGLFIEYVCVRRILGRLGAETWMGIIIQKNYTGARSQWGEGARSSFHSAPQALSAPSWLCSLAVGYWELGPCYPVGVILGGLDPVFQVPTERTAQLPVLRFAVDVLKHSYVPRAAGITCVALLGQGRVYVVHPAVLKRGHPSHSIH